MAYEKLKGIILSLIETVSRNENLPKVTYFIDRKNIVRATRRKYKSHTRNSPIEILLTFGRPNYSERAYLKKFKGDPSGTLNFSK
jgi:hypothetical protein